MRIEERVLARLLGQPLLTLRQLAGMCWSDVPRTREAVSQLHEAGWIVRVPSVGPGHPGEPEFALSAAGLRRLSAHREAAVRVLGPMPQWQLTVGAVANALIAGPVTRTANEALAAIAEAIRREDDGTIAYATARPPYASQKVVLGDPRPPLRWGHAEARWQAGGRGARFALFCDRPDLPSTRRQKLFAEWRAIDRDSRYEDPSVLLVVCPTPAELERWLEICRRARDREAAVAFALRDDLNGDYSLDDAIWWSALSLERRSLRQLLPWQAARRVVPRGAAAEADALDRFPLIASRGEALYALRYPPSRARPAQRAAASLLALDSGQVTTAHLLAAQSWLSAEDVALSHDVTPEEAARCLAAIAEAGVAMSTEGPDRLQRWVISEIWMRLIAAQAGDASSWKAFAKQTAIPWVRHGGPVRTPVEHEAGTARMLGLTASGARRAGLRLEDWRTEHWWKTDISKRKPVPDAAFRLRRPGGRPIVGMIEYERLQGGHQADRKVGPWVAWYEQGRARELRGVLAAPDEPPVVLIVFDEASDRRASLMRSLRAAPPGLPIFAASEQDFAAYGLHAAVWSRAGGGTGPPLTAYGDGDGAAHS